MSTHTELIKEARAIAKSERQLEKDDWPVYKQEEHADQASICERLADALEAEATKAELIITNREDLGQLFIDLGATITREHGEDQVEWVNAPLDVVLDQVARLAVESPTTVEWGVRLRHCGTVEECSTKEKAAARAAGFSRIESRDGKLIREIPPSDPERGRELVTRTITPWIAVQS